jgi:hypothetical protein
MTGASQLQLPFSFPVLVILSIVVSLVSVMIAFDARERGMTKFLAIIWFFAIQLFPPIIILYLLLRYLSKKQGAPPPPPGGAPSGTKHCPYCGAEVPPDARICGKCSKLL